MDILEIASYVSKVMMVLTRGEITDKLEFTMGSKCHGYPCKVATLEGKPMGVIFPI